jgi:hypothetical protein
MVGFGTVAVAVGEGLGVLVGVAVPVGVCRMGVTVFVGASVGVADEASVRVAVLDGTADAVAP